jgi:hypothetical protein
VCSSLLITSMNVPSMNDSSLSAKCEWAILCLFSGCYDDIPLVEWEMCFGKSGWVYILPGWPYREVILDGATVSSPSSPPSCIYSAFGKYSDPLPLKKKCVTNVFLIRLHTIPHNDKVKTVIYFFKYRKPLFK